MKGDLSRIIIEKKKQWAMVLNSLLKHKNKHSELTKYFVLDIERIRAFLEDLTLIEEITIKEEVEKFWKQEKVKKRR